MGLRSGTSPPQPPPLVWEAPGPFFLWGSRRGGRGSGAGGEGRLGKAGRISAAERARPHPRALPGGVCGSFREKRPGAQPGFSSAGRRTHAAQTAPRADTERLPFSTQIWDMSDDETV